MKRDIYRQIKPLTYVRVKPNGDLEPGTYTYNQGNRTMIKNK